MKNNKENTNNKGYGKCVAALVLGIVSIITSIIGWLSIIGFITGIIAICLGVSGKSSRPNGKDGKALAGLICGIIAVPLSICSLCCTACIYYTTKIIGSGVETITEEIIDNYQIEDFDNWSEDKINDIINSIEWDDIESIDSKLEEFDLNDF